MNHINIISEVRRTFVPLSSGVLALLIITSSSWSTTLAAPPKLAPNPANAGTVQEPESPYSPTCPDGQCFTDVPPTNTFFSFINSLYLDNIISGYPCGNAGEPCDGQNRPYYSPIANVTRGQMAKFVDNGRRNVADAYGLSLILSQTVTAPALSVSANTSQYTAVLTNTGSGAAVFALCPTPNTGCYAMISSSAAGERPGFFTGGRGIGVVSIDANQSGLYVQSSGANSVGADLESGSYQGALVHTDTASAYSLAVDHPAGGAAALDVAGSALIVNDLIVGGSKTGYVVDIMQNAGSEPLEAGDVVTVVGTAPPVLGEIPLVTVTKASTAYDTRVVGVVDKAVYVPDARTKATYDSQQVAYRRATDQRNQAEQAAIDNGRRADLSLIPVPPLTITDEQGSIHSLDDVKQIATGGYVNVVTLGSYKEVKADASFGPIHKGDLLVASQNPGYVMKATDRSLAFGATIGKALADLDSGTGTIPVLVTLK